MIDISSGRYWDLGLQLIDGCTPCSPGCDHCWSAANTNRFGASDADGKRTGRLIVKGKFTGEIITHPERLDIPLKRRKPTVWAVWNDWCHENVTDGFRREILSVARQCPQHTILALTKRIEVLDAFTRWMEIHVPAFSWPKNWWNILTICNQEEADKKLSLFMQIPGLKGLSIEPMLGAVDLTSIQIGWKYPDGKPEPLTMNAFTGGYYFMGDGDYEFEKIDAVILGGETIGSKPGREMKIEWAESVVDQCVSAGVPVFVKQLHIDGRGSKDMAEWPESLRRRELPWLIKDR